MTVPEPAPDVTNERIRPPVSADLVRQLTDAIARLANDPDYFVLALTDMLLAMEPITKSNHSLAEIRFLIESGAFTAEEWAETSASVSRGTLQLGTAEWWLSRLLSTMSLEEVTGYLDWSEEEVRNAIDDGRLEAIEISDRLRFPTWQFDAASPEKLLPGLTEILAALDPGYRWYSTAALMATPQSALVAEGRKTPAQWLRDGGDVAAVQEILEAGNWF
ncbi:MAG TPA: hypothetical protein VGP24_04660 [Glaciihabitans sp.]|jgi:hypothetical protein|nr:hypothetical protein [Glaciihabitans sp.]